MLLKLELLSTEAIIRAKSQKYGRFTGDFLKTHVYTGMPVLYRRVGNTATGSQRVKG